MGTSVASFGTENISSSTTEQTTRMKLSIILVVIAFTAASELRPEAGAENNELKPPFGPPGPPPPPPPPPSVDLEEEKEAYDEDHDPTEALTTAGLFEGDIQLTEGQLQDVMNGTRHPADERNALNYKNMLWPGGVIPYVFASGYSSSEKSRIRSWLRDFETMTCVRVVPRTNQRDYVYVFNGGGCYSNVGKTGGQQKLSLSRRGCIYRSTVVHEFMHAAGFWHEQSRADRDQYVYVNLNNVATKMRYNFNPVGLPHAKLIGNYDYRSVMQYGSYAFSNNGQKTMILRSNPNAYLGQYSSGTMTAQDVTKLKTLYGCDGSTGSCVNKQGDSDCNSWQAYGYCTGYYGSWMKENCAKACKAC